MRDTPKTDASKLVEALNPDTILDRLAELERESRALRVLLRAARALGRRQETAAEDERPAD